MIILGIDPGSRKTGYAILKVERLRNQVLEYGIITLTDLKSLSDKLVRIYRVVDRLLEDFRIQSVAVEAGFYGKNAQSVYKLGYARSAAVLAAALRNIEVTEYSPRKVKQAVTGNGNASKYQVNYMVRKSLHIEETLKILEDEADAFAVALCHVQNRNHQSKGYKNWKEFVALNRNLVVSDRAKDKLR